MARLISQLVSLALMFGAFWNQERHLAILACLGVALGNALTKKPESKRLEINTYAISIAILLAGLQLSIFGWPY